MSLRDDINKQQVTGLLEGLETMARRLKERPRGPRGSRLTRTIKLLKSKGPAALVREAKARSLGLDKPLPRRANEPTPAWKDPESYFSTRRVVVYMAMFGGYDQVLEPVIQPDNVDYVLITDAEPPTDSRWTTLDPATVLPSSVAGDPVLSNRWCKMHPHLLFPEHELSVYLYSNILVVSDLTALTATLDAYPVAMFRHKQRACAYDEIRACEVKGKAPRESLVAHERLLREHGVPEGYGMAEAPIIARKHVDQRCIALMDTWWEAFLAGSRRDQISLVDALWQSDIAVDTVATLGPDFRECDLLVMQPHTATARRRR